MKASRMVLLSVGIVCCLTACSSPNDSENVAPVQSSETESPNSMSVEKELPAVFSETAFQEVAEIPEGANSDGSVKCTLLQKAWNGQCACGQIPLSTEDAANWSCVQGIWLCLKEDGCTAKDHHFPKWGYLGKNHPENIPKMPREPEGYELKELSFVIHEVKHVDEHMLVWTCTKDTCMCNGVAIGQDITCQEEPRQVNGAVHCGTQMCVMADTCLNGQCLCGETPQTNDNVKSYLCKNGQPVCKMDAGCTCNDRFCPYKAVCDTHGCSCGKHNIDNQSDVEKYQCLNSKLTCMDKNGCQCGSTICSLGAVCTDGQCFVDNVPITVPIEASKYKVENNALVCKNHDGCKCGDLICPSGSVCDQGKCLCNEIDMQTEYGALAEGYQCINCSLYIQKNEDERDEDNENNSDEENAEDRVEHVCEAFSDYKKLNDHHSAIVCHKKEGCVCGQGYTPFGGKCIHDQAYCQHAPILPGEMRVMNTGYICTKEVPQPICDKKEGCACGSGKCPNDFACVNGQCLFRNESYLEELTKGDLGKYRSLKSFGSYEEINNPNDITARKITYVPPKKEFDLTCNHQDGCQCGDIVCPYRWKCSDKVGCRHPDNPEFLFQDFHISLEEANKYDFGHGALFCPEIDGCQCGKEICPHKAICTPKGCLCEGKPVRGITKQNVAQNECFIPYTCYEDSCQCGEGKCPKDTLCTKTGCECGFYPIPLSHGDEPDYACMDSEEQYPVCTNSNGCSCGKNHCKQNEVCRKGKCMTEDEYLSNYRGEDYYCEECEEPMTSIEYYRTDYTQGWRDNETRFCPSGYYDSDYNYNNHVACTDCEDFSCAELRLSEDHEDTVIAEVIPLWQCLKHGGCYHAGLYYRYGELIDEGGRNYTGSPNLQYDVVQPRGEEVVECSNPLPDGGCSIDEPVTNSKFYCHSAGHPPELRPAKPDGYLCKASNGVRHWFCSADYSKACACGNQTCGQGAYCLDEQCLCGDEPHKEGYRCEDGKQICNSSKCLCGDEPLRPNYICTIDDKQICKKEGGCPCGTDITAEGDICAHDTNLCTENSNNVGCLCGDIPLKEGYRCVNGTPECHNGYWRRRNNQIQYDSVCSNDDAVLCGGKPLMPHFRCLENNMQQCSDVSGECLCGDMACHYGELCVDNQCVCQDYNDERETHYGVINPPGCLCDGFVLQPGYKCINNRQVCHTYPELMTDWTMRRYDTEQFKKRLQDYGQNFNDLAYTCPCGDGFVLLGETCQNGQRCTDCERIKPQLEDRIPDEEGYFTAQCEGIRVQYVGDFKDPCICTNSMPDNLQGYYCKKTARPVYSPYIYDWICHDDQCACGNETCHKRESCVMGKCYAEKDREQSHTIRDCGNWVSDPFHGITHAWWDPRVCLCNNMEIIKRWLLDSGREVDYKCDNGTAWQCLYEYGCNCGSLKIPKDSYCLGLPVCGGDCSKEIPEKDDSLR